MEATLLQQCNYCAAGFHFLCASLLLDEPVCCCIVEMETIQEQVDSPSLPETPFTNESPRTKAQKIKHDNIEKRPVGRPEKQIGEFDDQLSAGRKRASRAYQIKVGTICEWAWRKNNGGGITPVTGCSGRFARHIHHGPDKSTLNNDRESNISLVCTFCHQLWHVRNDKYYPEPRPDDGSAWLPIASESQEIHELRESEPGTVEEIVEFELSIDREMSVEDWKRIRDAREFAGKIVKGAEK